jgi:Kef-type K+ transport system membrane component KefB/nucleotide-binding universal stress UspA family protein
MRARRPFRQQRLRLLLCLCFLALCGLTEAASAAGEAASKSGSEAILLTQILLLILLGRALGEAMLRLGQPAVMGQLLAGILLGPSVLGTIWPAAQQALFPSAPEQKSMIDGIAQFGILMLLLLAGMETDLSLVRRVRRAAASASIAGIALPFVCGFMLGQYLPDQLLPDHGARLFTSLFLGTALSISSVKIVATVVREMGFLRRDIGQVILASAIVDDTIGWIIIAIILSLATHGTIDWLSVVQSVLGTLVFLGASFTFGRRLVFRLIQWSNDNLRGEAPVIATILMIMGTFALITHVIGVHAVLGAFVAGILVGESPMLTRQIDEDLRGLTAGLFMPVFFGLAGLSADLTILSNLDLTLLTLALVAIASIGKTLGAFAGGWLGGLSSRESLALACGMNARGSTEVIVASIGLSMGVLSHDLFTMIVAMAFITTMAMPPTLRWALQRLPMQEEERQRLDRETFEARAFVPNLERILVAVDDSAKGHFASRVSGLIAGLRGTPVTVLKIATNTAGRVAFSGPSQERADNHNRASETLATAAETIRSSEQPPAAKIDLIERQQDVPAEQAVANEARKGYDLLVVGLDPMTSADGGFHEQISRMANAFEGSIAIVVARGEHLRDPAGSGFDILVPVTGSDVSRRGAEFAMALAKAADAVITALTVVSAGARTARDRFGAAHRDASEIVKEVKMLARFSELPVRTAVRTDIAAEDAILRQARVGKHDTIVFGVSRRPGQALSFGPVAAALLESSERSLIFVASQAPQSGKAPAA